MMSRGKCLVISGSGSRVDDESLEWWWVKMSQYKECPLASNSPSTLQLNHHASRLIFIQPTQLPPARGSLSVPYPSAKESFRLSNTHSPRGPGQQYYPWLYRNPELNPTNQWIQHVGKELVLQSCKSCCAFPKMPKRDTLIFIKHNGNRNEVWQIRPLGLGLIQPWRTGAVERGESNDPHQRFL